MQANDNGYKDAVIQITDGKLKFVETKVQAPLSYKYIEEVFSNAISDKSVADTLIQRLKENREVKYVSELKRYNS